MLLRSLQLRNFRLYEDAHFTFSPHNNFICGHNAIGKTSLLEAVHFLIAGHSFRCSQATNLIRHGSSYFYLEAHFIKHGVEQRLRVAYSKGERKIWLNNTVCPALTSLLGTLLGVILTPSDLQLISGAPQERRLYLDNQLAQVDPLYLHHLQRYNRATRQRNLLLKSRNLISIESWEWEMATSAAYLLQRRLTLLNKLQEWAPRIYASIAENQNEKFALSYRSATKISEESASVTTQAHYRESYLKQFCLQRPRELALATTLYGPHKDDLMLTLNGDEARYFASEGQQRSCAAALRLAEWYSLREAADGEEPLMLVDDITISLDNRRSHQLLKQLENLSQLFLTTTQQLETPCTARPAIIINPKRVSGNS